MLRRTSLPMLVLILSLSLSSNTAFALVEFYDSITKQKIENGLFNSIMGLEQSRVYTKSEIQERLGKFQELVPYKVDDWNTAKSGWISVFISPKKKISKIEFQNNTWISSSKLLKEIGFRIEGAYCEDICSIVENKVRKYYADQGFYEAGLILKEELQQNGRYKIILNIQEGDPSRIASTKFQATGAMDDQKLSKILKIKVGDRVRYSYIQERVRSLKRYLFNRSYYSVNIKKNIIKISDDAKTADVELVVDTGPKFSFIFRGNETFNSRQTLINVLDIGETDVLSRDYYSVLVRKLEDFYYSMGFEEPEIDITEVLGDKEEELKLVFDIKEGKRKFFRNIRFNVRRTSLKEKDIRAYVESRKPSFFDRSAFVKKDLEEIRGLVEEYFAGQGFLRARVLSLNYFDIPNNRVDVIYEIDPGSETIIRSVNIRGNHNFTSNKILKELEIKEGSTLKVENFGSRINKLVESYREEGYSDVTINRKDVVSYSSDHRVADINVEIEEGKQNRIGEIFIEGLVVTKHRVVTREFQFSHGDTVLFSKLQETENRLALLGIFGSVSVILLPTSVKGDGYRDVLIKVDEKKSGIYEIGFGYRTDDGIKVSSGVTYGNLGGWNRRVSLDGSVSRKLDNTFEFIEYEVNAGYYEPYFWNLPLDFRVTTGYSKHDLTEYDRKKLDISFYFERSFGHHRLTLRNSLERINVFNARVSADDAIYWKYSVRQIYRYDTRDSVFNPNRGVNFMTYVEWGHTFKSSIVANYVKVVENIRYYLPFLGKWTFVPSLDAGYVWGLQGESVLLDERFMLGGMSSLRGYREHIINDLTPRVLSQYFYTFTIDIRRQLFWKFVANVFHDIGSISSKDMSLQGPFSSVGGGISLQLPVGSLGLQYGYVYDVSKRVPPDKVGRLHFSLGTF